MSSETSENDNVDIGPVSGSRPVGSADPPNPAFDLEASLSRLEPPRHRLIPVEKVDGVRVERSEKVTVERAGIDGGGQSETVKIERTETVYDEQSDAVRIERSETVRVERIHTSQYDSLPSLLEQSSSAEVAQQMLDDSVDADGTPPSSRTSIPDRPPPPQRPFPEPRQKAPVVKLESEQIAPDETIIEARSHSAEEQVVSPQVEDEFAETGTERSSERIEVPDRVYEAVEVSEEDPSPGAYRYKSGPRTSQRRPAFFVRGQAAGPPNHRNGSAPAPDVKPPPGHGSKPDVLPPPGHGSKPDVLPPPDIGPRHNDLAPPDFEPQQDPPPPATFKPQRNGASRLDIPRPKFRSETTSPTETPSEQPGEHTGPIDLGAISTYGRSNGTGESGRVGENTGPVDVDAVVSMTNRDEPAEMTGPNQVPKNAVRNASVSPASPLSPNFGPTPVDLPAPPQLDVAGPNRPMVHPAPPQLDVAGPNRPMVHPAPPQFDAELPAPPTFEARQPEPPRFQTPKGQVSNIEAADEIDPFDEYLEDPLGFFDPSEEVQAIDPRRPRPDPSTSTRQLQAPQRSMPSGRASAQGPRSNGHPYELPESDFPSRVQPSGSSRNGQRPAAPNQRAGIQDRPQPDEYFEDDYDDRPRRRPVNRAGRPSPGRQQGPRQRRRPDSRHDDYQDGGYRDNGGYEDEYDDPEDESSPFPGAAFLRSKAGTILVGVVGFAIMGLSAMYVFSGQDAPEGEILESEGVYWWVNADVSSKSFIPESCADSLQSLGANKKSVPFSDLEAIPREDISSCEEIIAPG